MTAPPRPDALHAFLAALRAAIAVAPHTSPASRAFAAGVFTTLEHPVPAPAGQPASDPYPVNAQDAVMTAAMAAAMAGALVNARAGSAALASLADAFAALRPQLSWQRRAGSAAQDAAQNVAQNVNFHHGHANTWIVAPQGLEQRSDVVVGASVMAAGVRYPLHRHPPEELYLVMSPGDWYMHGRGWHTPGPGAVVHHPPGIEHAMRAANDAPLLAVWCLQSAPALQR